MKRETNLYNKLLDKDFIKNTIMLASRGKSHRREVKAVLKEIDIYVDKIYEMFKNGTYFLYPSHNRTIVEKGKQRELTISPFFPNRVLDYCFVEALKPRIRKGMYVYCIGNVDRRGAMYGQRYIKKHIKEYKYYIQLDIHHFYPSVSPQKLIECLNGYVKDKRFMEFASFIISANKDLPIGSYYSQWLSNLYLQKLDHKVKENMQADFYVRYVDDMLVMGNNKRKLKAIMYGIQRELNGLGLTLKRVAEVREIEKIPIDFLGFRFYHNKTYLRMRTFKTLNKRLKKVRNNKYCCLHQAESIMSYMGWFKQTNGGYGYYKHYVEPTISYGKLRRIISNGRNFLRTLSEKGQMQRAVRTVV